MNFTNFGILCLVNQFSKSFCLVSQLCLTLCNYMACSTPGFPVGHHLQEFAQTCVCWVGDAIPPSHPLSSPSPACSLSQHQGLFQWVSSSQQVAKVLELQHQYFQWIFRIISLRIDWCDLLTVQGTLKFSTAPQFWRHQFFFIVRLSHSYMAAGKTSTLTIQTLWAKWCLYFLICCLGLSLLFFQGTSVF